MRDLDDLKIGTWILTADLLGTAVQMSEIVWIEALKNILDSIMESVYLVISNDAENIVFIQYGDTMTFCHNNPETLVMLGIALQKRLFHREIMGQLGLSGAGGYYIDDSTIHRMVQNNENIKLQCFVGSGLARSHIILKGVYGQRFFIDEEWGHIPANRALWSKYFGPTDDHSQHYRVSEVRWWSDIPNIKELVNNRLIKAESELCEANKEKVDFPHPEIEVDRNIDSLDKKKKHLDSFYRILTCDPEL